MHSFLTRFYTDSIFNKINKLYLLLNINIQIKNKGQILLHTGYMMEHNLSNIKTGVRKSSKPYFFTVSTQTAMKAIVSDSVPKQNKKLMLRN